MTGFKDEAVRKYFAQTYDTVMEDWPGEIRFYRDLSAKMSSRIGQFCNWPAGQDGLHSIWQKAENGSLGWIVRRI